MMKVRLKSIVNKNEFICFLQALKNSNIPPQNNRRGKLRGEKILFSSTVLYSSEELSRECYKDGWVRIRRQTAFLELIEY